MKRFLLIAIWIQASALLAEPVAAAWQMIGPYGGAASIIRVAPSAPETVVAGTRNAQIYISSNAGKQWARCQFPVRVGTILYAIAIDPTDAKRWYAGVANETARWSGIYRTTDGGQNWTFLPNLAGHEVWSLATSVRTPQVLLAGTSDGIHRSRDGGDTWERISPVDNQELRPVVSVAIDPADDNFILAGTTHLPWRTMDGGKTWQSIHTGMLDDSDVFSVTVHPTNRNIVYASACSGSYRSASQGTQWARLATPRGAFRTYVLTLNPNMPQVLFAGTSSGLLRSADEGRTWTRISPRAVRSIAFAPKASYFASDAGVFISHDNGLTLQASNAGFTNGNWLAMAASGSHIFAAGIEDGVSVTSDAGSTWQPVRIPDTTAIRFLAADAETVYAATTSRVWKSTDNGKSWTQSGDAVTGPITALSVERGNIWVATGTGLLRNPGKGAWTPIGERAPARVRTLHRTKDIIVVTSSNQAAISLNSGQTWDACSSPTRDMEWFDLIRTPAGVLLAATSHGVFQSRDCRQWSLIRGGLDASTAMAIVMDSAGNEVSVAQRGNLFRSSDGGANWSLLGGTDDSATPMSLHIVPNQSNQICGLFPRRGVACWINEKNTSAKARLQKTRATTN